ncbi:FAD-dependent 5-carboxymethylaminomethyl-2-thiouridine(34) oxidoreductase MnmC [Bordetella flabilis]|uniref:tRNA 5-methylaminomethyl-2-thiouridine biosynthesis bifunctional protein MnmC n=1 Tax=Bordetella flabilis TaxID=463014 RepID=A0A193GA82_9BORD|nr:FAD-dependent 5-carboxymethylaminomethyl-2-thiouridine(34) oxidoreductase MnmC [Bordetella flabilis]ANN76740.1 FAD-dependent cmnm(5)s(2)U34 oxidoreductase [Bordetella flabilis]
MFEPRSVAYQPLKPAAPATDARGVPYSLEYDDVYHPVAGAFAQAHYVFLDGNGLPGRWRGRHQYTVCETGFGLGVNFLTLWRAWREDARRPARLHVVSFEAHPLPVDHLSAMLDRIAPDAAARDLAGQLAARWPPLLPGIHRLEFEAGRVTLTLAFGDAGVMVPALPFAADAFFLDGFAPSRNPAMWTPELLAALANHAVAGATAATWCSAGAVRRGLQDVGFRVDRRPGFAGKTHMTVAVREAGGQVAAPLPPSHVAVVGGGIAGAAIAHALSLRDVAVTVFEKSGSASVHQDHAAAAVTPLVARDDNVRARLSRAGSLRAAARWGELPVHARPWRCGTLQLARDAGRAADAASILAALRFPATWVRGVDAGEASDLAGLSVSRGGLYFAAGMLVRPHALIGELRRSPGVRQVTANISRLAPHAGRWQLYTDTDEVAGEAPVVVLANAVGARAVLRASGLLAPLSRMDQMHALAGEVTALPAHALHGGPRCIIGGEGYLLPAVEGWCVAGSTYAHGAVDSAVTEAGQGVNLAKAAGLLGQVDARALLALAPGSLPGWAGWRAVLPGRLPAIGTLPHAPGVVAATGFASRGLTWAALAGDMIAGQLCGEPSILERDLQAAVAPR